MYVFKRLSINVKYFVHSSFILIFYFYNFKLSIFFLSFVLIVYYFHN